MEVKYVLNLADYAEVLTTSGPRTLKQKMFGAVIGGVLIILCLAVLVNAGFRQGVAALIGAVLFPGALVIYRFVIFPLWVRADFCRHPNFSREQILRVDENGLHKTSEVGQSFTKWPAYTCFRETQNLFLLYLGERSIEVVPKGALSSTQLHELRQLLHKKLPENINAEYRDASVSLA
jgi:YcxB-like protein